MQLCRLSHNSDVNHSANHNSIEFHTFLNTGDPLIISSFLRYGAGVERHSDFHIRILPEDILIMLRKLAENNHHEAKRYVKALELFDSVLKFDKENP